MIPTVRTERLTLRAFEEPDIDAWSAVLADPEGQRYVGGVMTPLETWLRLASYQGHWQWRGYGQWAVVETSSGRLVGRAGLWFPLGWPEREVGWHLARDVWGLGYATEAGQAAIEWGRETLGLTRIASVIHRDNARSIAVAERLGMSFDRAAELGGQPMSVYAMSL